jgi:predicted RNase H-like HicB family nuclease
VKREYEVLYQPIEDGWIMATVPDLPGAVTQGRSMDEARAMIKEAVELLLQSYRENAFKDAPGNSIWETISVEPSGGMKRRDFIHHLEQNGCYLDREAREKIGDWLQIAQQRHQSLGRFNRANLVPVTDFLPLDGHGISDQSAGARFPEQPLSVWVTSNPKNGQSRSLKRLPLVDK